MKVEYRIVTDKYCGFNVEFRHEGDSEWSGMMMSSETPGEAKRQLMDFLGRKPFEKQVVENLGVLP